MMTGIIKRRFGRRQNEEAAPAPEPEGRIPLHQRRFGHRPAVATPAPEEEGGIIGRRLRMRKKRAYSGPAFFGMDPDGTMDPNHPLKKPA